MYNIIDKTTIVSFTRIYITLPLESGHPTLPEQTVFYFFVQNYFLSPDHLTIFLSPRIYFFVLKFSHESTLTFTCVVSIFSSLEHFILLPQFSCLEKEIHSHSTPQTLVKKP